MTRLSQVWQHPLSKGLPRNGHEIEKRSLEIVDLHLDGLNISIQERSIIKRIIHATADLSFADTIRISTSAVKRGIEAIQEGRLILCDVRMLQAGITQTASDVLCLINELEVIRWAKAQGTTRAAAAFELSEDFLEGSVVAIGNAPTALFKVLELAEQKGIEPALVVGFPVGFVGASRSKEALWRSHLVSITNRGSRGGSSVTAAAINAIALMARESNHDT